VIRALSALAQETRLDIFRRLIAAGPGGLSAGRVGEEFGLPSATLSFHLKELRNAGIVTARKDGRFVIYSADFAAMKMLVGFLLENCCQRPEGLLAGQKSGETAGEPAAEPVS
jgi:DNA-binding transcriptional ArsR family regulator